MTQAQPIPQGFDNWHARLDLAYAHGSAGTIPVRRWHQGPLRVQKHLYPEGTDVCQHIIVHPPGGIAGGDRLDIAVTLQEDAHVLLTSPGAAKWYRGFGRGSAQNVQLTVGEGATLEWLPQETILFDGAEVSIGNRIDLAADARLISMDVVCLGRQAAGERFLTGAWRQRSEIWRAGRLIWHEQCALEGGSRLLDSAVGMGGDCVVGCLVWAGEPLPQEVTAACRQIAATGRLTCSQLPDIWIARYLGGSIEDAHAALRAVWTLIRPATLSRAAVHPRIWAT
jgi:urease accessory protein